MRFNKQGNAILILLIVGLISFAVQASDYESRILVKGAAFSGANGIRVSPGGQLYVASAVGGRIDVLDPASGKIVQTLDGNNKVFGPDDLAFSPQGQLYWTAFFTGAVMRLNAQNQGEMVAYVGPGVNAISFSADGRLFVSRVFLADELYEIDPQGIQAPRLIKQGLGGFNAMDFGPDGLLYGPLWFKGQVAKIDVDTGELSVVAQGLETPAAVRFSNDHELYAVDQHQGTLLRINRQNGNKEIVAYPGLGADNLAFDENNLAYISNAHEGSVSRVLPNGEVQAISKGGLSMPGGLALTTQGEVVVAASQSLRFYDKRTGTEEFVSHASIGDTTTVATPLTVSRHGEHLLVTSWFSNSVQIWDPDNQILLATYPDFVVPTNAVSVNGDIIVAELGAHRVVRRNTGTRETEVLMGIPVPTGLAAGNGKLYVADWLSGSIYQLMMDNQVMSPVPIISGLHKPEGMALDKQGRLLVVETGLQRLLRIDPASPQPEVLANNLAVGLAGVPGYPPHWLMSSVVVDQEGGITVSQDLNNSLLRIEPEDGDC